MNLTIIVLTIRWSGGRPVRTFVSCLGGWNWDPKIFRDDRAKKSLKVSILLYNQTGAAYKSLVKMTVLKSNNNVAVLSPRFRDVLLLILNHANQQFLTVRFACWTKLKSSSIVTPNTLLLWTGGTTVWSIWSDFWVLRMMMPFDY